MQKAMRQTNFELMRLVCMFYIVIYHLFAHCVNVEFNSRFFIALTTIFHTGVINFVMLSGYFHIKRSYKGGLKLYGLTLFYSILGLIYFYFEGNNIGTYNILSLIFPLSNGGYWFLTSYFILFLLAPYINESLCRLNQKQFGIYLLLLSYIVFIMGFLFKVGIGNGRGIIAFILMYSLGYYLKKFPISFFSILNKSIKINLLIYATTVSILVILITYLPLALSKILNYLFFAYNSPGLYVLSLLFFFVFKELKWQNTTINRISTSTLAIYLLHENKYLRVPIYDQVKSFISNSSEFNIVLITLITAIIVCTIAISFDKIRIATLNFFSKKF